MTFKSFDEYYGFIEDNPKFTGVCVVLHPNGKKWYEYNFVNGKHHRKQYCWYENGKKWFEYNFVNGKHHGKQFSWHENGQKWYEENYVSGFQVGIQLSGKKIYEVKPKGIPIWYILVKEAL